MAFDEVTTEAVFEADFLEEVRDLAQEVIPYVLYYDDAPKRLPFRMLQCLGEDWIDEESADRWMEEYWESAATTFDYVSFVITTDGFHGPEPGEINPFASQLAFCDWMFLMGASCLLVACPGMCERWHSRDFKLDLLTSIVIWHLLEDVDLNDVTPELLT